MPTAPLAAGWARQYPGAFGAAASAPGAGAGLGALRLSAVVDLTLARVRLTGAGLPYNTTRVEILRYDTAVLTNGQVVRGSELDVTSADVVQVDDYEFAPATANTYVLRAYAGNTLVGTAQAVVTPTLDGVWLVNVARPFVNRRVTVAGWAEVTRPARGAVHEVLGRVLPVAVTEVRGSRRFTLTLVAADQAEADAIELALSFGDTVFLQIPSPDCPIPGPMHVFVADVTTSRRSQRGVRRYLSLPLTEVDGPDSGVVGATITWQGVLSAYPTWADLLAAKTGWLSLLESISAPADEVTG